ncbi:hypothetical protein [Nocardia wallacei]|uniref:hypothetical protein n=1 Tax=Nocardia wallacei TaxID=480035 RepID=UPI002456EB9B|nr:hypothetical protein [Nocardia wallacei]
MASEDDAGREESGRSDARDRGESEFGPPLSEFGPPLGDFGPPLKDFGPPTGEVPAIGWVPADAPERPTLGWQPADAPAVPPPPPQYRAPDSSTAGPEMSRPVQADPRAVEPGWSTGPEMSRPVPADPRGAEPRRSPGPDLSRPAQSDPRAGEPRRTPGPELSRPAQAESRSAAGGSAEPRRTSNLDLSRPPLAGSRGVVPRQTPRPGAPTPPRESSGSLWDDDDLAKKLVAARPTPQRESSSSLWDDDDLAKKLAAPRPEPEAEPEKSGRNTRVLLGGLAAAFVVILAIGAVIVFATRNNGQGGGAGPAVAPSAEPLSCPAVSDAQVTIGNGAGDTSSGPQAILGFEHGYFAERSAVRARAFAVPDANLETPELLQKIIESQVPQGTSYCVRIETVATDRFLVDITTRHPDGTAPKYTATITTVNRDGKNLIQLIE